MDDRRTESMNPGLLLALWRERWGKSVSKTFATPHLHGQPNLWAYRLTHLSAWSLPGVTGLIGLFCLVLFIFLTSVDFSASSQIIFSLCLILFALYAQRYAGTFIALLLLSLTIIVSARYLYWRFSATLVRDIGSAFVLGFCLCAAEVHVWVLMILRSFQVLWPLKQKDIALPIESGAWPTVDILILCHDQSLLNITSTAQATLAMGWPKHKLKTYFLDNPHRAEIQALADSTGATYLAQPEETGDKLSNINQSLSQTHGELIAIFEVDRPAARDLLKMTIGWFVHDTKLAMVQTPGHFLAPPPSKRIDLIFDKPELIGSCSLIRRSALLEVGGVNSGPVTARSHTALNLQAEGYNTAYFSLTARSHGFRAKQITSFQQQPLPVVEAFQIDHPFGDRSLLWKQRLEYLKDMLEFYDLVPRLIFLVAPLTYLLFDAHIIDTSAAVLVAYTLPLLVHAHIIQQRLARKDRFSVMTDMRETALAWYILVLTTFAVIRAELSSFRNALKGKFADPDLTFNWQVVIPYATLVILTMAGLMVGVRRLPLLESNSQGLVVIFLLWSTYNMMILAAALAVTEESRSIRRHASQQCQIPAMIKLPSGHTVSCVTQNFPEIALALKLPAPIAIEDGAIINISVFHANREYSFPAQVDLEPDLVLRARIDGTAQNVYRALGVAAYSRGQSWPKWLPSRNADHLFPLWLPEAYTAARFALRDVGFEFGRFVQWGRFRSWMQIWKKNK